MTLFTIQFPWRIPNGQRNVLHSCEFGNDLGQQIGMVVGDRVSVDHAARQLDRQGTGRSIVPRNHNCRSAMSMALSRTLALLSVSWYSLSGTLSATMPAPAWIEAVEPCNTSVRRAMQVSMLPVKSM